MKNTLVNKRDQEFILFEQMAMEQVLSSGAYGGLTREDVLLMRNEAEKMALRVFVPLYAEGDRQGCTFENGQVRIPPGFHEAYRTFVDGGWFTPPEGGPALPVSVRTVCAEFFYAANFSLFTYPGLTAVTAGLIGEFGTARQKERYGAPLGRGDWTGTMCMNEADAGTDLGAVRTPAKRLPDGSYGITGSKCFITNGDHDLTPNIIHLVLARIEGDPPGMGGLSAFIVPKFRLGEDGRPGAHNDVHTGNIEEKMGIRGSATCTLNFGDNGDCVGELLGREREGFRVMCGMMDVDHLGVAMQGLGHATAAYEHAAAYAKERIQCASILEMNNPEAKPIPIIGHPDVRRNLLWMKAHVEGMRALNYFTAWCMDMAAVTEDEEGRQDWQSLASLLVPVCKVYCSDTGFLVCSRAMDVYGGYGYCSDYPIEQYLRDCKIASVYEGPNGILALDLVGRRLGERDGAGVKKLFARLEEARQTWPASGPLQGYGPLFADSLRAFQDVTGGFAAAAGSGDILPPVLYASPFLRVLGDLLVAHFLFEGAVKAWEKLEAIYQKEGVGDSPEGQRALAAAHDDAAFYQGKIAVAKFFANEVLMTVKSRCDAIRAAERAPLEMADESF